MFSAPKKQEINSETIKLLLGIIALFLANAVNFFASQPLTSISASYHEDGTSRNLFVGLLFAIAAFLLAYNGRSRREMFWSKIAAMSAFGIALIPSRVQGDTSFMPNFHYIFALIMFIVLVIFCFHFSNRAKAKGHAEAMRRSTLYLICASVIIIAIAIMVIDYFSDDSITSVIPRITYICEKAGLIAFGISWLIAAKVLPWLSDKEERHNPFQ